MLNFLNNPWIILGLVITVIAFIVGAFIKGDNYGYNRRVSEEVSTQIESVENAVRIETRIMRLPKNEVQKLLEDKWCRDC